MNNERLDSEGSQVPRKGGLEPHRKLIAELRNNGHSWRAISAYLSERGVEADHSKIYRFMEGRGGQDSPLYDKEGLELMGGEVFENRRGKPLKNYLQGNAVRIIERGRFILLEENDCGVSTSCECQFLLDSPPNDLWFKALQEKLRPLPYTVTQSSFVSRCGFEIKIEGTCMALVCPVWRMKEDFARLLEAMHEASIEVLEKAKHQKERNLLISKKKESMQKFYVFEKGKEDEAYYEHLDFYRERSEQFRKVFDGLPV